MHACLYTVYTSLFPSLSLSVYVNTYIYIYICHVYAFHCARTWTPVYFAQCPDLRLDMNLGSLDTARATGLSDGRVDWLIRSSGFWFLGLQAIGGWLQNQSLEVRKGTTGARWKKRNNKTRTVDGCKIHVAPLGHDG